MSSSSVLAPAARPPRSTWRVTAWTCSCWRSRSSRGEGLRRRADPARGQAARRDGDRAIRATDWPRNRGLRVIGGGVRLELDWPDLASYPDYGLTRTRMDFDELLAEAAAGAGAHLRDRAPQSPARSSTSGPAGSSASRPRRPDGAADLPRAVVVAADGVSGRFPLAYGPDKRDGPPDRRGRAPLLPHAAPRRRVPGVVAGTAGHADGEQAAARVRVDLRDGRRPGQRGPGGAQLLGRVRQDQLPGDARGLDGRHPAGLGDVDEDNADGPIPGAALPMGFNRVPHYTRGVMLVGDSGGMVNPFNGEGIAYAMESGALAAEVDRPGAGRVRHGRRGAGAAATRAELKAPLRRLLPARWMVRGRSSGDPEVMRFADPARLPHPTLMRFVIKLLANLTDQRGGDAMDRVINAMTRLSRRCEIESAAPRASAARTVQIVPSRQRRNRPEGEAGLRS